VVYSQAKTWRVRPSELVSIEDPYTAYCFDEAIFTVGVTLEAELDEITDKKPERAQQKRDQHLRTRLGLKPVFQPPPSRR
jgi:hypothetical protein